MKKKTVSLLALVASFYWGPAVAADCGGLFSAKENRDFDISDVARLKISGRVDLNLVQSETFGLSIEARKKQFNDLTVSASNNTLTIKPNACDDTDYQVKLRLPRIELLDVGGAVNLNSRGVFQTESMNLEISGALDGEMELAAVQLNLDVSGSSNLQLSGSADSTYMDISGSSEVDARYLVTKTVRLDVSGSSNVVVNVADELRIDASGSTDIAYLGTPKLNIDIAGSGSIRALDD